jgi:hydrogenase nickel incorporation protein HypA/HybF
VHELSIALSLYATCRNLVQERGPGRLERVRVAVGELSAVDPELLSFAWQAVTEGGPHAGATLDIDWRPARAHCPSCHADQPPSQAGWLHLCQACGAALAIEGGTELDLLQLSITDPEAPS